MQFPTAREGRASSPEKPSFIYKGEIQLNKVFSLLNFKKSITFLLLSSSIIFIATNSNNANAASIKKTNPNQKNASNILPKRIISLSPSATEDLFAIGAGQEVIAVDNYSNFPHNVPSVKLESLNPNVEAIASKHPDLVVIQSTASGAKNVIAALNALKIKSYEEITPSNLDGAYQELTDLGNLTGHIDEANAAISYMKSRISNIVAGVKLKKTLTFYHELDNTGYSVTSQTFIGQVYKSFGLQNIADAAAKADDGGYPQLQSEYVIKANPDLIFLADGNGVDGNESYRTLMKRPGFAQISSLKNNHIVLLPADIPSRWGPRLVQFYSIIARRLNTLN